MVRYADDFVILCRTPEDAQQALTLVQRWTEAAGLQLHPEKTHLVDMQQPGGFDFLGYHFERGHRWPRKKSLQKLKDAVRQKTRRTNGHSLAVIIADVNRTLVAGLSTSNTATARSEPSTRGSACACAAFCASGRATVVRGVGTTISAGQRLLCGAWAVFLTSSPCGGPSVLSRGDSSTGEPDAGDPPVRFGGRGRETNRLSLPLSAASASEWRTCRRARAKTAGAAHLVPFYVGHRRAWRRSAAVRRARRRVRAAAERPLVNARRRERIAGGVSGSRLGECRPALCETRRWSEPATTDPIGSGIELGHLAGSATAHLRFERLLQTCAPARWTVNDIQWEVVPRAPVQG